MNSPIDLLSALVAAVERSGANIAPTYHEYMPMAFGIANSCGEAGRGLFHRLCSPSPRYVAKEADRLFNNALRSGRNSNSLGTVWFLADRAGVDLKGVARPEEDAMPVSGHQDTSTGALYTRPHARTLYIDSPTSSPQTAEEEDFCLDSERDNTPAPLPDYDWPAFMMRCIRCGVNKPQQDVLLLSVLTTLGATMAPLTCFFYGNRTLHPCLQAFLIAPPASGKGVMGWARRLAQPFHDEKMRTYEQACAIYRSEKQKWDTLGKERANQPEPERPKRKLFFISGDNSGTGILENLIDQEGQGMIFEPEASTLSDAIGSDYGNWSPTLRKAFDHDGISYNRRTNYEHRECAQTLLSVLISGTPGQLRPLIPSAENGLFSRQLFYYMPPLTEWVSQFHTEACDYNRLFEQWGQRWKRVVDALHRHVSRLVFVLSREQEAYFDAHMAQLFSHGGAIYGSTMRGAVVRIAINLLRLMNIVAVMRVLDGFLMCDDEDLLSALLEDFPARFMACTGVAPQQGVHPENLKDGTVSSFTLSIREDDFGAVMGLLDPLYRHSIYALSQLPEEKAAVRTHSKSERFLGSLPVAFTRREAVNLAAQVGLDERSCDKYLQRLVAKGILVRDSRGEYVFNADYRAG